MASGVKKSQVGRPDIGSQKISSLFYKIHGEIEESEAIQKTIM